MLFRSGVIESYCGEPKLAAVKRLDLSYEMGLPAADAEVAIQIDHVDGKSDLIIARDVEDPAGHRNRAGSARVIQKEWDVRTDCELLMVRRKKDGSIEKIIEDGEPFTPQQHLLIKEQELGAKHMKGFI